MFNLDDFVAHTVKLHLIYLLFELSQSLICMNADLPASWSRENYPLQRYSTK